MSEFIARHIGPKSREQDAMLKELGFSNLDEMAAATVPKSIRFNRPLQIEAIGNEYESLHYFKKYIANENKVFRSLIGMGYSDCITPPVIQRNILENPGWYTQYTPYQSEIAQGRLEALVNFQTMVTDLTQMEIANASLLDEGTAAAEAMGLSFHVKGNETRNTFIVASDCHPQTLEVLETRATPLGIKIQVQDPSKMQFSDHDFGVLIQYPNTFGSVANHASLVERAHEQDLLVTFACDLLSLAILKPPGEMGADIAIGSSQRFGVPLGFGGPHAAFFATREQFKRQVPGRIVGVSVDAEKKPAYRLALQTREQHIRREKATSNICTAQVLLAIISGMYAVYHGPEGIRKIASDIHLKTRVLHAGLKKLDYKVAGENFFDTFKVQMNEGELSTIVKRGEEEGFNFRVLSPRELSISLDETISLEDLQTLIDIFSSRMADKVDVDELYEEMSAQPLSNQVPLRTSSYLTHPVFNTYHSETEMLRYLHKLQRRDLSLTQSMIPLGSCTMKLNATAEMFPVTWPEIGRIHPFAPKSQVQGYLKMFEQLEEWLSEITGFSGVSLQPNAGSQGEYAGLLVIRKYFESKGEQNRNVCLIPTSAHGTNPASAVMAGMKVVGVLCDNNGNIDVLDLKKKAQEHASHLAALMVTYPSTHGVFEEPIKEICDIVHQFGGQVYMDGANMNAQMGLCRPADFGADVCHLNLHKTFCIPHGGGGPGMGPIGVKKHLIPFLPGSKFYDVGTSESVGAVSSTPWGSASILPISWMYIAMMGGEGLKLSAQVAILNANYVAKKLAPYYPVLYKGREGMVAHECILDLRGIQERTGVTVEDVAKRLMDYGFHAPTVSWPVAGTMMIEPTESEGKEELDRFCEAMILIAQEIKSIETGSLPKDKNPLKLAPHTAAVVTRTEWDRPYSREIAAFPAQWTRENKFWPAVSRIDNAYGDRNLFCSCPPWG